VPQARLGGGTVREEQHHITGPGKLLSRGLLQQFVCSYTQMSYGHTKGGKAGNARYESYSVRRYRQDRWTLLEVKISANAKLGKRENSTGTVTLNKLTRKTNYMWTKFQLILVLTHF